jgi:cell division protein FtsL
MNRTNLILLVALIASSLVLVKTAHDARRLYTELDRAQREERKLADDLQRLDGERQAQATHLRVEKIARERLRMRNATATVTQYVEDPGAAPAAESAR